MAVKKLKTMFKLGNVSRRLRPLMPFTALNTLWKFLDKGAYSILDIGCGKGEPMRFINRRSWFYTVGLDIFKPYLLKAKRAKTHDDYVLCDVNYMPVKEKAFDVVIAIELLEHLTREDGIKPLKNMERLARKQVIITTPVSKYEQHAYDNNPYQEHKYLWNVNEIVHFGYCVKGVGLQGIAGERGVSYKLPLFLEPILHVLWVITGIFTYNKPTYAGHMVCFKNLVP